MRGCAVAVGAIVLAGTLTAESQAPPKLHRIGILFGSSPVSEMTGPAPRHSLLRAFLSRLGELGYVYGQNLATEPRSTEGDPERYGPLAAELARLNVDVIFTVTNPGAQAAKAATRTIPIVMLSNSDPMNLGLVTSLAE